MKSIAAFVAISFFAFALHAQERGHSVEIRDKDVPMKKLASYQVHDTYTVELYLKPKQMKFNVAGRVQTPTWTMIWLEATDLKTENTRRVWATYHPWNIFEVEPRLDTQREGDLAAAAQPEGGAPVEDAATARRLLRDFTFGVRNERVIALAYVRGGRLPMVRFHEIDLTQQVEAPRIPDQPLRPGAAYTSPRGILNSNKQQSALRFAEMLQQAYGEEKANALLAENELRIKDVAWSDGKWRVTLTLGSSEFSFVRGEDDATWQLQNAPQ